MLLFALWLSLAGQPDNHASPESTRRYQGPLSTSWATRPESPAPPESTGKKTDSTPIAPRTSPPKPTPQSTVNQDGDPGEVRTVVVSADALGEGTEEEAFRHAGGRSVVGGESLRESGAASLTEALGRAPGVRAVEGSTGQGSGVGTLSVAVRGVNPRLSDRTTVLLDEVPLAMAPYGQPQMSLFPVPLFSIDRIDVVRGGASVRFGPRTGGGVFNLISRPIPQVPQAAVYGQVNQFGQAQLGTSYAGTHRKFGMRIEYAPSFGRNHRDHSGFQMHGGLVKFEYPVHARVTLASDTHYAWQQADLPGGLSVSQYQDDRLQSVRPFDERRGWRIGQALKVRWTPNNNQELQTIAYYNHTLRSTRLEQFSEGQLLVQPRTYDALGLEPRYKVRLQHKRGAYHELRAGLRGVYELALLERQIIEAIRSPMPTALPTQTSRARLAAYSLFVDDELFLFDETLKISAGVRGELIRMARRDGDTQVAKTYWAVLPAASVWYGPVDQVALFAGYGRSFAPPDFVEIAQETAVQSLTPEIIDAVEGGLRIQELVGFYGSVTPWLTNFLNLRDPGEDLPERIGNARAWGIETELSWEPGDLWDAVAGSEIYAGHAWTQTSIYRAAFPVYQDKELAWYPRHEAWAGFAYALPFGCALSKRATAPESCRALKLGFDLSWTGRQFSEFTNAENESALGTSGPIPSYMLMNAYIKWRAMLPGYWPLELTVGMKNLANVSWFERSDDINGGRLAQAPRAFYVNLGISHYFVGAADRRARRQQRQRQRRRKP